MPAPWSTILAGLIGLRLRVYDDLLLRGEISTRTLAQLPAPRGVETLEAVLIWLQAHRFIRGTGAAWRSIPIRQAQELWESHGPAESVQVAPLPKPAAAAVPLRTLEEPTPTRAVHPHQSEIFAMDGWSR